MIVELTHCNYGPVSINIQAITEVSVWQSRASHGFDSPRSVVAFGNEHGWAFRDAPEKIVEMLTAAGIKTLAGTCARDRHGQPTWLVVDQIVSARSYGPQTTDLHMRLGTSYRMLSLHEPYEDFVKRWKATLTS